MMLNKMKTCKPIDLESKLKEFISKNFEKGVIPEKINDYIKEISQNRMVISQMSKVQDNIAQLRQNISILTTYINMLSAIMQKITFGKEAYSCKIEFTWSDTIKDSNYDSYNIFFEFYNVMFNLATSYYILGTKIAGESNEKNGHKEANKSFKNALYLFDAIKEEAVTKIPEKELPLDLFPAHLDYCKILCEIEQHLEIYCIAKETNPKLYTLHAKLLCTISELYARARQLADGPQTRKGTKDEYLYFLENKSVYSKALMCKEMKEDAKKIFDEKGDGYGVMLFYQGLFVTHLNECQKTIKKCGNLVDQVGFEKMLEEAKTEGQKMHDLNKRIYMQQVPKEEDIVFEKKVMTSMTIPEKLYIRENSTKLKTDEKYYTQELDLLVVKEVKAMIDNYKTKMDAFISSNLKQFENETKIQNLIKDLSLPKKLITRPGEEDLTEPPEEVPFELWQKIEQIHQLGGLDVLNRKMQGIINKSNFLIKELENFLKSLELEDKDDDSYRQKYKEKWCREPSQKLNFKMVQSAQQFLTSLNGTKKFDRQESDEITDNSQYFQELLLPRDMLLNKIPKRDELKDKEIPEETELRESIMKLYEIQDKCNNIIKHIYNVLNDDSNIVDQFVGVLDKKTTENAIYEKYKEDYEKKIAELKTVNDELVKQEEVVKTIYEKNIKKIREKPKQKIGPENQQFFNNLDQCANMFLKKFEKIKKGDNYYNDIYDKVCYLVKTGTDWMIKRSDEKNVLLSAITKDNKKAKLVLTESCLLDPKRNPFTNFNIHQFGKNKGNYGRP